VLVQDVQLASHVGGTLRTAHIGVLAEVGHIGVPCHLPQRHALPAAADQEWQVRLLDGPKWQRRVGDPEVPTLVGEWGLVLDASDDLDRFLQGFLPFSRACEMQAQLLELPEEITGAEPENQTARAHAVDVRAHARDQARLAVAGAAHERPEADAGGDDRPGREGGHKSRQFMGWSLFQKESNPRTSRRWTKV